MNIQHWWLKLKKQTRQAAISVLAEVSHDEAKETSASREGSNHLPALDLVHFNVELTPNYLNSFLINTGSRSTRYISMPVLSESSIVPKFLDMIGAKICILEQIIAVILLICISSIINKRTLLRFHATMASLTEGGLSVIPIHILIQLPVQYGVLGLRVKVINLNILPESSRNELKYSLKIAFMFLSMILKFQVLDINILLGIHKKATVFDGPWSVNLVLRPRLR